MSVSDGLASPPTDSYEYEREPGESVCEAIVTAVSEFSKRPPATPQKGSHDETATVLPPLYDYVATDALDTLVARKTDSDAEFSVTFSYEAYTVTVQTRTITVTRSD